MNRFDDCVRSERYFTATLLPTVLFHDGFAGLRAFIELIESRIRSEHDRHGTLRAKAKPHFDFADPEVITEFHIARDVHHAGGRLATSDPDTLDQGAEKRDAPDLVIVLGAEIIVVEAKFFVTSSTSDLQAQLRSQKRQVRHLFENRPSLRAWRHVALIPDVIEGLDCDAVITWKDIAGLSRSILGPSHYVTRRLDEAVARCPQTSGKACAQNFESKQSLPDVLERCRSEGDAVWVGHSGGEADLRMRGASYAKAKQWKWRHSDTGGTIDRGNWIAGTAFLRLIASLGAGSAPQTGQAVRTPNYDGVSSFSEVVDACRAEGRAIQVGHTGGESDLARRGLAFAQGKRWKWRSPATNRGVIDAANWIAGDRFAGLMDRLR